MSYSPYNQPEHTPNTMGVQLPPPAKQPSKVGSTLVGLCIIGLIAYLVFGNMLPNLDGGKSADVVDVVEPTSFDPEGSFVVVVSESKGRSVEQVSAINQFSFWREYIPSKGMRWYLLDPQDDDATTYAAYAATQNRQPPFIVHVDKTRLEGNKSPVLWMDDFPPAGYDPKNPDLTTYKQRIEKGE